MKRREATLLLDMLISARAALSYVEGLDRDRFEMDELIKDAVTRRLEVLGEAAGRISEETRAAHPAIPWTAMVGMRNRLIHEYFRVDADIVWTVLREELPRLIEQLEPMIPSVEST